MSTTRARSAATDEAESGITAARAASDSGRRPTASPSGITDENPADAGDDEEEEGGSGDSSSAVLSRNRSSTSKKKGAKGRRDRLSAPISRSRHSKASQSAEAEATDVRGGASDALQKSVKQEAGDSDAEDDGTAEYVDQEGRRHTRRRSASGLKELAGLGLQSLGDGADEPLAPRRSRRSGTGPNELGGRKTDSEDADGDNDKPSDVAEQDAGEATPLKEEEEIDSKPAVDLGAASPAPVEAVEAAMNEEDEGGDEGVTRCLCGSADENVGLMIQCETCKCWQHCICMGMRTEEDCPDVYFCEQCRPELHIPLLRLLGVLPAKNGKKSGSKTGGSRPNARDSSKELKDAKDAVLNLAKENERRRREGREPVTGWSVAQEQEFVAQQRDMEAAQQQLPGSQPMNPSTSTRRQGPEPLRMRRSNSRDDMAVPKSPPKRRSTMNSRDSVYGWEPIPPGLLNEDEVWEEREDKDDASRKRKRSSREEDGTNTHSSGPSSVDANMKRRRTSPGFGSIAEEQDDEQDAEAEGEVEGEGEVDGDDAEEHLPTSQPTQRTASSQRNRTARDSDRPRHPNQYTKRAAAAAAAAAAAEMGGSSESTSPGPSPHKTRAEGMRRSTRETAASSRTGTPTPGEHHGRRGDGTWALPEHLGHLAHLLPPGTGPEPLRVSVPTAKAGPKNSNANLGGASGATRDAKTDRIIKASPQPFNLINLTESSTKIKYPGKRMTLGEMRKRVRNILEFVQRLQIESVERERRMRFLGITRSEQGSGTSADASPPNGAATSGDPHPSQQEKAVEVAAAALEKESETAEGVAPGATDADLEREASAAAKAEDGKPAAEDVEMQTGNGAETEEAAVVQQEPVADSQTQVGQEADDDPATAAVGATTPSGLAAFSNIAATSSMALVDELTRELVAFQNRFGAGTAMALSSSMGY